MNVYCAEQHVCNTFAELLRLLTHQLKDCNNGQDKEKEVTYKKHSLTLKMLHYVN